MLSFPFLKHEYHARKTFRLKKISPRRVGGSKLSKKKVIVIMFCDELWNDLQILSSQNQPSYVAIIMINSHNIPF